MAKKHTTPVETPQVTEVPVPEIVATEPAPTPVVAEATVEPEKTGLALFLSRYQADQRKHPGELQTLQWKQPAIGFASISSKYGTLLWPDGSPAVFGAQEAREIAAYLRPIRPLDQINIQPA